MSELPVNQIVCGDCLEVLRTLPDNCVHCCVTSPPYWGLRDYGVEGQIGLEPTPEEYVAKMVEVFREVRRVLLEDGTLWLNLGDSYTRNPKKGGSGPNGKHDYVPSYGDARRYMSESLGSSDGFVGRADRAAVRNGAEGLKEKDLVGIPWRVAFALQADGWVLRQEIIWEKPNPMPESVRDRCTKAHEQIFLFAKAKWVGPERGRFADISDDDARWIALFIETEGNICVKRVRREGHGDFFGVQIAVANSFRPLLEKLQAIVGAGNIHERLGKNAPVFYWQVSNKVGRDLLHRIYPHMIGKKRQARIGIYLELLLYHRGGQTNERKRRTDKETTLLERLWADNKSCNKFQNPDLSYVPEPEYGRWISQPYFYDAEAVREPSTDKPSGNSAKTEVPTGASPVKHSIPYEPNGFRNKRSVWTVPTAPFKEAHFATFPPELIRPCIRAGCPKDGIVLDPFGGSGTTGYVAAQEGRNYILIELNPKYVDMAETTRLHEVETGVPVREAKAGQLSLFPANERPKPAPMPTPTPFGP